MARNRFLATAVTPLIFILVLLPGCSGVMEAYREQTSPSSEMPIQCKFVCPVTPDLVPAGGESRLDSLVVVDVRENRESIGSMYSADGPFTLICMDERSFERILEGDVASLLDKHSIAVDRNRAGRPSTGVSLYVEILNAWVESRATGLTEFKVPIEASVIFRTVLQDDKRGIVLWEAECRGKDTEKVFYSFSRHHAVSLEKAYCEAIHSFETAVGSAEFLRAIRR